LDQAVRFADFSRCTALGALIVDQKVDGFFFRGFWGSLPVNIIRGGFKMLQFGQDQGEAIISTGGMHAVFRGLKWEPNADIARNGAF